MKVLVTGAGGQVGYEILRSAPPGFDVFGMSSSNLDITDKHRISSVFSALNPDLVINAAAYTDVDKAESEKDKAYAINAEGVAYLGMLAEERSIPVFHISTDYVFSGETQRPYIEQDKPEPLGVYGLSKLEGERELISNCSRHIVLRTSWVFGVNGNNFVKTVLRLGQEKDELSLVFDQRGCPTSAASIAHALWILAEHYLEDKKLAWGIYHYCGASISSWYEFGEQVLIQGCELGLLSRMPLLHMIRMSEYPTIAVRPAWSVLSCSKLRLLYNIPQYEWRTELRNVLYELAWNRRLEDKHF